MKETATFALGCFWGPDEYFSKVPGVLSTTVGYSGGTKENPTYYALGDHTETVNIEFDPGKISYADLLELFWQQHNPAESYKTQYKSAIFTHGGKQQTEALASKEERQKKEKFNIVTEIVPAGTFYPAEDYHQKYLRKNSGAVC